MEMHEILRRIDAPDELSEWVERELLDFDQAWEGCRRGDHRIWLAACGGAPIEELIEAAAAALLEVEAGFTQTAGPVVSAIESAVAGGDPEALLAAAEACERISEAGIGGYRASLAPGYEAIARGGALLARAAEGLVAGAAAREAGRLEEARHRSSMLGVGSHAALPAAEGPPRLDVMRAAADPAQGVFLFCVAAAAQAVLEAEDAATSRGQPLADARRTCDALARQSLERRTDRARAEA